MSNWKGNWGKGRSCCGFTFRATVDLFLEQPALVFPFCMWGMLSVNSAILNSENGLRVLEELIRGRYLVLISPRRSRDWRLVKKGSPGREEAANIRWTPWFFPDVWQTLLWTSPTGVTTSRTWLADKAAPVFSLVLHEVSTAWRVIMSLMFRRTTCVWRKWPSDVRLFIFMKD